MSFDDGCDDVGTLSGGSLAIVRCWLAKVRSEAFAGGQTLTLASQCVTLFVSLSLDILYLGKLARGEIERHHI